MCRGSHYCRSGLRSIYPFRPISVVVCLLPSTCRQLTMHSPKLKSKECASFDYELAPDVDSGAQEDLSFWRPFSLRFERDAVEKAFYRSVSDSWHVQDIVAHSLSILFVPAFFKALGPDVPWWHIFVIIFLSLFFAPLQLYTYCTDRPVFSFIT